MRGFLVATLLLLVPAGAGYPESAAPTLHPDVDASWHEPPSVAPGSQWQGFLRLEPGHNVTGAYYQVCKVGKGATCFAPPTAASWADEDTLYFGSENYTVNGIPVHYKAGWRVGVKWCLAEGPSEAGDCDEWVPPQTGPSIEDHYLVFEIEHADEGAPPAGIGLLVVALLALVAARRA